MGLTSSLTATQRITLPKLCSTTPLSTQQQGQNAVNPRIAEFILDLVLVLNRFILQFQDHSCNPDEVLWTSTQISCPIQDNGIDCGLFAVAICLHIFDGVKIHKSIFTPKIL